MSAATRWLWGNRRGEKSGEGGSGKMGIETGGVRNGEVASEIAKKSLWIVKAGEEEKPK